MKRDKLFHPGCLIFAAVTLVLTGNQLYKLLMAMQSLPFSLSLSLSLSLFISLVISLSLSLSLSVSLSQIGRAHV